MPHLPPGEVVIRSITGDDGRLPLIAVDNCVGIAAIETLNLLGQTECGIAITLDKVCVTCVCTQQNCIFSANSGVCHNSCFFRLLATASMFKFRKSGSDAATVQLVQQALPQACVQSTLVPA